MSASFACGVSSGIQKEGSLEASPPVILLTDALVDEDDPEEGKGRVQKNLPTLNKSSIDTPKQYTCMIHIRTYVHVCSNRNVAYIKLGTCQ